MSGAPKKQRRKTPKPSRVPPELDIITDKVLGYRPARERPMNGGEGTANSFQIDSGPALPSHPFWVESGIRLPNVSYRRRH